MMHEKAFHIDKKFDVALNKYSCQKKKKKKKTGCNTQKCFMSEKAITFFLNGAPYYPPRIMAITKIII